MIDLEVILELNGREISAGTITGSSSTDAFFTYSREYVSSSYGVPLSISLPLQTDPFTAMQTKNFFDGLLPEGFTRRTIASGIHASEDDYISILTELGKECLGAIRIKDNRAEDKSLDVYVELSLEDVKALASEGASKSASLVTESRLSLTGASGKVGLYYDQETAKWYLPKGNAPSNHIVKQSHIRLDGIVTNEQLCMLTAKKLGIDVPDSFIINTGAGSEGEVLYAVARYDRYIDDSSRYIGSLPAPYRLHQEDFAQALGIAAVDKYEPEGEMYFHKMIDILRNYSIDPIGDILKLFDISIFNWLVGNTDAHVKNYSLLRAKDGKGIHLAPAYDLLCTDIYENNSKNMAYNINGKYSLRQIQKSDFLETASKEGIAPSLIEDRLDQMQGSLIDVLNQSADELLEQGFINTKDIHSRILLSIDSRKSAF